AVERELGRQGFCSRPINFFPRWLSTLIGECNAILLAAEARPNSERSCPPIGERRKWSNFVRQKGSDFLMKFHGLLRALRSVWLFQLSEFPLERQVSYL